jgi:hypothetical protein
MKLKWGKLGKHGRRPFTGFPTSKTNKNLRRARKRAISSSMIWRVYMPPVNHNYIDLSLRLQFTRKYDPYQELSYYSFEECLTAVLLVRFNQTLFRQKHGKPSSPKGERSRSRKGRHDVHAEWRKAAGVRREGKSFSSG